MACTWRLLSEPAPDRCIPAERIADHRLLYLDYEGPVSGNRGTVTRWDAGVYVTRERTTDRWRIELRGTKFCGEVLCEPIQVTFGTTQSTSTGSALPGSADP